LETSDVILWDSSGYEDSLSWDYNWIKHISIKIEKMIAGNITVNKLKNLSKLADTVDVSGALETNKVKDINKIKDFISQLKKIND
jgi:phosphoribosylanthranilate isomerase